MNKIFVDFLPPWVETGLQPAFYDKESGTVLQQTARMYAHVNKLCRLFNRLSKDTTNTVNEYISKFDELYSYVHDYFDNLDVQEEINNKLDAMAEAGTLSDIISQYLNSVAIFGYDTVADMVDAPNLTNGSFARTLGYSNRNDGNGALYKVRTITNDDVIDGTSIIAMNDVGNTLVAELIVEPVIRTYDTLADMKVAPNLVNGTYARTLGYYAINDNGGGLYKIRTITNDDVVDEGSIVAMDDNTLVAELIIEQGDVIVNQFGAKGDGITDDSQAIQKAIDKSKGLVNFDENKTYSISNTVIVKSNTELNGNNCTIKMNNAGDTFNIDNTSNINIHDFILENGEDGNNNPNCDVFITTDRPTTNNCYNINISNIKYDNEDNLYSPPFCLIYVGNVYGLDIHDCNLKGNQESSLRGIVVWSTQKIGEEVVNTNSKYIRIHNNIIDGFNRNIESYGTSGTVLYGSRYYMIISDNHILNATDTGIMAYHGQESMIKNNYVLNCKRGCWADNGILAEGNYFSNGEVGLWTEEFTNGNISNNIFNRLSISGIILGGGTLVSNINSNTFRYCEDAITIDEQYTPNTYYSGNLNIQNNKITSCYSHVLNLKSNQYSINFTNNFISVWGLEKNEPVDAIVLGKNVSTCLYINNNVFDNKGYNNAQPLVSGNCNSIINTSAYQIGKLFINNNNIDGDMNYLGIIKVGQVFYFLNNIFKTPITGLLQLSAQGYAQKYVIKGNTNLTGADTLGDQTGGTSLQ